MKSLLRSKLHRPWVATARIRGAVSQKSGGKRQAMVSCLSAKEGHADELMHEGLGMDHKPHRPHRSRRRC